MASKNVTLTEARRFVKDHAQRIISDPASCAEDEVATLAMVAVRLRDALDAEQEALRAFADDGIRPY